MRNKFYSVSEKVIRDNVHGDIILNGKYVKIINSKEFQRLRRIKQLSVANYIFPGAEHTRFSHSIGTFYVMQMIISQVERMLGKCKIEITNEDKEVALVSALLHDIGHGPFSHAFESVIKGKSHEDWTIEIIKSHNTEVNGVLRDNFGDEFPEKVASLISKKELSKKNISNDVNLHTILVSLISSQLDADRLDYLLRDSMFTGVPYGNIDLQRIIKSISITSHDNEYCLCFPEKYVGTLSDYLLARFQMNQGVYYHPCKLEFEKIIELIFDRIKELPCKEQLPDYLLPISNGKVELSEYLYLDDCILMSAFSELTKHNDLILSSLCKSIIYRDKFERLDIRSNTKSDIDSFYNDFVDICKRHCPSEVENIKKYVIFKTNNEYNMYKTNKENIKIISRSGAIKDISEVYVLFDGKSENGTGKFLKEEVNFCFLNQNILYEYNNSEVFKNDIDDLLKLYDNRHNIEIEMKYMFDNKLTYNDVIDFMNSDTELLDIKESKVSQVDYYFDDKELAFFKSSNSLRIRHKNNMYQLTLKLKVEEKESKIKGQHSRYEYNKQIEDTSIDSLISFIEEKASFSFGELINVLTIKNERKKIEFKYLDATFELAYDDFSLFDENQMKVSDNKQIEIELKSELSHKVILKKLSDKFISNFTCLSPMTESKFAIGMSKINK